MAFQANMDYQRTYRTWRTQGIYTPYLLIGALSPSIMLFPGIVAYRRQIGHIGIFHMKTPLPSKIGHVGYVTPSFPIRYTDFMWYSIRVNADQRVDVDTKAV